MSAARVKFALTKAQASDALRTCLRDWVRVRIKPELKRRVQNSPTLLSSQIPKLP